MESIVSKRLFYKRIRGHSLPEASYKKLNNNLPKGRGKERNYKRQFLTIKGKLIYIKSHTILVNNKRSIHKVH